MILNEMCGGVVEDAKFLFIFVRVSAAGRALPATLAWWILATGELQFFVSGLNLELFEGSRSGGGGVRRWCCICRLRRFPERALL